jgi:hypothetical protein
MNLGDGLPSRWLLWVGDLAHGIDIGVLHAVFFE